VNADGPRGDEQCLPDLAIGQPGRHECEHFSLAAGQAEGCRRGGWRLGHCGRVGRLLETKTAALGEQLHFFVAAGPPRGRPLSGGRCGVLARTATGARLWRAALRPAGTGHRRRRRGVPSAPRCRLPPATAADRIVLLAGIARRERASAGWWPMGIGPAPQRRAGRERSGPELPGAGPPRPPRAPAGLLLVRPDRPPAVAVAGTSGWTGRGRPLQGPAPSTSAGPRRPQHPPRRGGPPTAPAGPVPAKRGLYLPVRSAAALGRVAPAPRRTPRAECGEGLDR
jgi:hypothetical protein